MIIGIKAVIFFVLLSVGFTVMKEFGEGLNKENPVTVNVIMDNNLLSILFIVTLFHFVQEMGIRVEHYVLLCGNPVTEIILVAVTVAIVLTMHTVAIVLALRTRKIEVDAVNDAKEIQIIVYISTVIIIMVGIMFFALEGFPNAYGIAIGLCAYLECSVFLGFIFVPKVCSSNKE